MENLELLKQINKIQQGLLKKGIEVEKVVKELKKLRAFFIDEKMPRIVKIIRLTYEHLEAYESFEIDMPEDEDEEIVKDEELSAEDQKIESFIY